MSHSFCQAEDGASPAVAPATQENIPPDGFSAPGGFNSTRRNYAVSELLSTFRNISGRLGERPPHSSRPTNVTTCTRPSRSAFTQAAYKGNLIMNFSSTIMFAAASLVAASLATAVLPAGTAFAQSAPSPDGAYKGTLVCAQLPGQPEVIRVPLDIIISNNTVQFSRPIFVNGRAVGSEMGNGTIEGMTLHLKSSGNFNGNRYEGSYSGELALDGGTLMGTQAWTAAAETRTRTCTAAFVKARS
jgi:hypothetical protein